LSCYTPIDLDGQLDGTVSQDSFRQRVASLVTLKASLLDRVSLQKPIQFSLLAPAAFKNVVLQLAARDITDDWIPPVGQSHSDAGCLAAEELESTILRLVEIQPPARRADCSGVSYLGFDFYDMTQRMVSFYGALMA
jgi:hypothetical protein